MLKMSQRRPARGKGPYGAITISPESRKQQVDVFNAPVLGSATGAQRVPPPLPSLSRSTTPTTPTTPSSGSGTFGSPVIEWDDPSEIEMSGDYSPLVPLLRRAVSSEDECSGDTAHVGIDNDEDNSEDVMDEEYLEQERVRLSSRPQKNSMWMKRYQGSLLWLFLFREST